MTPAFPARPRPRSWSSWCAGRSPSCRARRKAQRLDALEALNRELAEQGLGIEFDPMILRLRRYEAACDRAWQRAYRQLLRKRAAAPASPS
ncbi:MAG: hypothetical protein IRY99_02955, partial [Isosphaeraceae bacterium]|nr:hypothetical protein [Isosphaeraceae bacterium]